MRRVFEDKNRAGRGRWIVEAIGVARMGLPSEEKIPPFERDPRFCRRITE
jgi:hypothetical protein